MGPQRDFEAEVSRSGANGSGTVTGLLFLKAPDFDSSGLVNRGQTRSNTLFSLRKKRKKRAIILWLRVFVSDVISVETEREKKNLTRTNIDTILCPSKESWCVFGLDSLLGLICNVHKLVVKLKQTNENTF